MGSPDSPDPTRLVQRICDGEEAAVEELLPLVYDQLRRLAGRYLGSRPDHTLQPTALVHEAFLKLTRADDLDLRGKAHFFALGARAMREILVDHARRHNALKRGGGWEKITLTGVLVDDRAEELDLEALDAALHKMADLDPRQARIVELRFFANMTNAEIGETLEISRATVTRELTAARAWLLQEMDRSG